MLQSTPSEYGYLDRQLARLLPPRLREDDLRVLPRALLLLRFTLIGAVFTCVLAPYFALYLNNPYTAAFNLVYAASLILTPVVLHRTGSVSLAAHWALLSALLVLVFECVVLGGVASSPYPWLAILPIGGMLLCGVNGGFIWGALASTSLVGIGLADAFGWLTQPPSLEPTALIEMTVSVTSLCLALTALGWLSESRSRDLVDYLECERMRFRDLSLRDPLTGLANRALLTDSLRRSRERSRRNRQRSALFFLDMDGFKRINDRFGHAAGDQVLVTVGKRLRRSLRASDVAARIGGDEFALIVEGLEDRTAIERVAETVAHALCQPVQEAGAKIEVGVSMGIVRYPDEDELDFEPRRSHIDTLADPPNATLDAGAADAREIADRAECERLLKRADAAMYEAKRAGAPYKIEDPSS